MATQKTFEIPELELAVATVRIIGDSSYISHAWDPKIQEMMEAKQQGKAANKKAPKDPEHDYLASMYRTADGEPGIPALAFKCAAVTACTSIGNMTKVAARQCFHMAGDILPIIGEPERRTDTVRLNGKTGDIRYRAEFKAWEVDVDVIFNKSVITAEKLVHLLNTAGFAVGVGEWRPERNGSFGRFHVGNKITVRDL